MEKRECFWEESFGYRLEKRCGKLYVEWQTSELEYVRYVIHLKEFADNCNDFITFMGHIDKTLLRTKAPKFLCEFLRKVCEMYYFDMHEEEWNNVE